jgi:hypothetical protein
MLDAALPVPNIKASFATALEIRDTAAIRHQRAPQSAGVCFDAIHSKCSSCFGVFQSTEQQAKESLLYPAATATLPESLP